MISRKRIQLCSVLFVNWSVKSFLLTTPNYHLWNLKKMIEAQAKLYGGPAFFAGEKITCSVTFRNIYQDELGQQQSARRYLFSSQYMLNYWFLCSVMFLDVVNVKFWHGLARRLSAYAASTLRKLPIQPSVPAPIQHWQRLHFRQAEENMDVLYFPLNQKYLFVICHWQQPSLPHVSFTRTNLKTI